MNILWLPSDTSDLITDGCKPPSSCWELNSGPLEEHSALNSLSLRDPVLKTNKNNNKNPHKLFLAGTCSGQRKVWLVLTLIFSSPDEWFLYV